MRAALAACVLTAAGGAMDAWVYLGHGHVFANAQSGNVVLFAIEVGAGHPGAAIGHVPSFLAFCIGIMASRVGGAWLKQRQMNSRTVRLIGVAAALIILSVIAGRLSDMIITASIGFIAAVQITTLSHIDGWSFNTGMTTGNLRAALSAASVLIYEPSNHEKRWQAVVVGGMCISFIVGATVGALATFGWGDPALLSIAAAVIVAMMLTLSVPDPVG